MCHFHLPTLTQLTELHFRTRNLDRALRFYSDALGFKILERTELSAALSATGEAPGLIRFTLDRDAAERQPNQIGFTRFGIRFPMRTGESFTVDDPDGNSIELLYGEADRKSEPPRVIGSPNAEIDYVSFAGKNLRSASRFFGDYLGLGPESESAELLSFRISELGQRIVATQSPDTPRRNHNSVGLISYKISVHCGELLYALNQRGAVFGVDTSPALHSPRVLQIHDPLGYVLEVEVDTRSFQRNSAEERNEMSLSTKSGWKALSPSFN